MNRSGAKTKRSRRGFTLLEVVLATLLLALVAVGVATTIAFINKAEEGRQRRLAGFEVASRLMLMFVDDDDSINTPEINPGKPYDDFGYSFVWEVRKDDVTVENEDGSNAAQSDNRPGSTAAPFFAGIHLVTISVYAAADRNGQPGRGDKLAEVSRLWHETGGLLTERRSNDSRKRNASKLAQRALELVQRAGRPSGRGGGGNSGGNSGGGGTGK